MLWRFYGFDVCSKSNCVNATIDNEKEIIDTIIKKLKYKTVKEISNLSHEEAGWKKTKRLEKISFEYAMNLKTIR